MGKKHYDNARDIIATMKKNKALADNAISSTFSAYMMMACMVLYEDFEYDQENIQAFVNGIYNKLDEYRDGKLTVNGLEKDLLEKCGVVVEKPNFEVTK